ncbi:MULTISPECIES: nucleoside/nucleotide kinase family protein [Rothia]|uniref:Uncharacterized protein n=1 Tax=Rothia kristinae TaxID=37923 RepID=A0A199NUF4_9MICC|nr:hypothetical protein [Rothia kristinae]MED6046615.1 hypothetical protein [Rothia kristinae]OAX52336.1 hypothetical protein AN277_0204135 [Rothia kristinae]QPT54049.1 hypothetical protein I6G21_02255 [Rothia kristinae]SIM06316.1 Para-aminobenzoate synthase [Mycobacteroides abscessus subsp. abscessus]
MSAGRTWVIENHDPEDADVAGILEQLLGRDGTLPPEHWRNRAPLVLAVDGRSGAGKTSLAARLAAAAAARCPAGVVLFHLEDLYPGWDGLTEGVRLWTEMLTRLLDGRDAAWRAWDWAAGAPDPAERILSAEAALIIAEGVGASAPGHPEVVPDLTVWLQLPAAQRRRRALARDGELYRPHWERWAAQEDALLARLP